MQRSNSGHFTAIKVVKTFMGEIILSDQWDFGMHVLIVAHFA